MSPDLEIGHQKKPTGLGSLNASNHTTAVLGVMPNTQTRPPEKEHESINCFFMIHDIVESNHSVVEGTT
jgi:hypothetical protein